MKITIPYGGFYAIEDKTQNLTDIKHKLESKQAQTLYLESDHVLLASFKQTPDQGIWTDGINAVTWDMDLTNIQEQDPSEEDIGRFILQLYEQHGLQFVDQLRGAFAFAIWDSRAKSLFIATDFYGLKPVVYLDQTGKFAAASRICYLLWADSSLKEINTNAIFHYLFFQAVCSPLTIYKSIKKLEPGKILKKQQDEQIRHLTHYDLKYQSNHSLPIEDWKAKIREQIQKAVEVFVPLSPYDKTGCFLSGGTDSSSVAGYYTQIAGRPAKTFSIGFDDPRYNELDYARMAANQFKTDYHEYYVTPEDVLNLIEQIPKIYDEPFGNASVIPAFYCAHHASQKGIEVLLGGDGGDEIFGGNERYVTNLIFQKYLSIPQTLRKQLFEPMLSLMPNIGPVYKTKRYVRRANIPNPRRFYSYNLLAEIDPHAVFQEDFIQTTNLNTFMDIAQIHYNNAAPADDTDRLLYLDMKFTIADNDIRKVTQMVEAAGLRVRYPLLDRDLVDFTCTIPPTLKVKWKKNRYIFKEAMKGFLPDAIINKSKHGMGLPVTPWFKKDKKMSQLLYDTLFYDKPKITKYINPNFLESVKTEFENDQTTFYGDNLWVFLILEMWLRQ